MDIEKGEYKKLLKLKIDILGDIYKNTLVQSKALDSNDDSLLGKLLDKREKYIERIIETQKLQSETETFKKDEETEKAEQSIQSLLHEIEKLNNINIKKAKKTNEGIAAAIGRIKLGERALRNGYYKRVPQQFGYFIDKKVGR